MPIQHAGIVHNFVVRFLDTFNTKYQILFKPFMEWKINWNGGYVNPGKGLIIYRAILYVGC